MVACPYYRGKDSLMVCLYYLVVRYERFDVLFNP